MRSLLKSLSISSNFRIQLPIGCQHSRYRCCVRNQSVANPLHWRHNGRDGVSNHQPHNCLLNGLFRRRSKKTSKLRATGLCAVPGEFPAQMASNAENVSIWWRHRYHAQFKILFRYERQSLACCITGASIPEAHRHLTARSLKVAKLWDSCLAFSSHSKIWLAPRQRRCRDARRIQERYDTIRFNLAA